MAKRGQNEGTIYQRQDGRWTAMVNLGWQDGKRVRKSFYGQTRKEVKEALTTTLSDIQRGLPVPIGRRTVAQYLASWLESSARNTLRPRTFDSYEELVRLHIAPAFEKVPLSKLAPQHVRKLINDKLASGLSARRVQYIHAVLRSALNAAVADSLIGRNVAALVKAPRVVGREVQPLDPVQARRFLESVNGHTLETLFTVALSLGLRQSEALGLRWRNVDFEAGSLRIRFVLQRLKNRPAGAVTTPVGENGSGTRPKKAAKSRFHLVEPKTRGSRRTIELPQVTLAALADHKERQSRKRQLAGSVWKTPVLMVEGKPERIDDLVFVNGVGNPYDASNITHMFQAHLHAAGIERHRFHDLRHTAATLLTVQNVHPRAIQAALGWENIAMLNRYTHFVDEMRHCVASNMDSVLSVAVKVAVSADAAELRKTQTVEKTGGPSGT